MKDLYKAIDSLKDIIAEDTFDPEPTVRLPDGTRITQQEYEDDYKDWYKKYGQREKKKDSSPIKKIISPRKKVKATAANTKNYDSTLALQKELISRGAKIDADGIMGPKTRAAINRFMTSKDMPKPRPSKISTKIDPNITGPELDLPSEPPIKQLPKIKPDRDVPPEFIRLPKIVEPDDRFRDYDPRTLNKYTKSADNEYTLAQGPKQPKKTKNMIKRITGANT